MEKLKKYFIRNKYATMKELKGGGFQTRDIKALVDSGFIEKVKSGLYKLSDLNISEMSYVDVSKSVPKGIICLISALEYHNLSTSNPWQVHVAIPHAEKEVKLIFPPVQFYYFRQRFYDIGIEEIKTNVGSFKIYNAEKTICDMFRYRKKLGENLALEGLKNYLKRKDASINKLWDYAIKCRVKTIMHPYIKAIVV